MVMTVTTSQVPLAAWELCHVHVSGRFTVPRFFPLSTKAINLTTTRHVYVHEVIRPIDVNELHM
jgi:hypothetical protein